MKIVFLILLSFMVVACASYKDREPSSEKNDVDHGINTDYYGPR